jgi:hypothetical protein
LTQSDGLSLGADAAMSFCLENISLVSGDQTIIGDVSLAFEPAP